MTVRPRRIERPNPAGRDGPPADRRRRRRAGAGCRAKAKAGPRPPRPASCCSRSSARGSRRTTRRRARRPTLSSRAVGAAPGSAPRTSARTSSASCWSAPAASCSSASRRHWSRRCSSVLVGVTAGYLGGARDEGLSALSNVFLVIPALPLHHHHRSATCRPPASCAVALVIGSHSLGVGRPGAAGADAVAAPPRLRRGGPGHRREHLADHLLRDPAEPDRDHRVQLRRHRHLRGAASRSRWPSSASSDLSEWNWGTILFWAQSQQALSPGRLVVVRPGRPGHRAARHRAVADQLRHRRVRQPAPARRGQCQPDARALDPPGIGFTPVLGDVTQRRGRRRLPTVTRVAADDPRDGGPDDRSPGRPTRGRVARRSRTSTSTTASATDAGRRRRPRTSTSTLHRGEVLGLAGESGSGKSTLAYGLTRLLPPPGVITGGRSSTTRRRATSRTTCSALTDRSCSAFRWPRRRIVFQGAMNSLNPVHKISDQLTRRASRPTSRGSPRDEAMERAAELLDLVGISADRLRQLPAPALRRHAPARDDRHGAGPATPGRHHGRADHRARRGDAARRSSASSSSCASGSASRSCSSRTTCRCWSSSPTGSRSCTAAQIVEEAPAAEIYRRPAAPVQRRPAALVPGAARPAPRADRHPRLAADLRDAADRLPVPPALRVRHVGVRGGRHAPAAGGHVQGPGARDGLPVRAAGHAGPATAGARQETAGQKHRRRADVTEQATTLTSAAAARGELAMEAIALSNGLQDRPRPDRARGRRRLASTLHRGAVTALVGESGSGKSTVARLLASSTRAPPATIRLHGEPVDGRRGGTPVPRVRRRVQMIFQDPFASLNPVHTVRYHLTRPLRIHHGRQGRETSMRRCADAARAGAAHPARALPGQVPARAVRRPAPAGRDRPGARRRPGGAAGRRAGVHARRLDPARRAQPAAATCEERLNLAILYITHDIASARYFADDTLVMYAGRIVEGGDSETVTQRRPTRTPSCSSPRRPDPDNLGSTLRRGANGTRGQGPQQIRTPEQMATTGCPFSSRCPLAEDRCRQEDPALEPITATRAAACWRLDVAAPELVPGLPGSVRTTEN